MKIILIIIILLCFSYIGYKYKNKLFSEVEFLRYLYNFHQYYSSNINLFKNNVVEIIDNFIIMQKNKNAIYNKIFLKNGNIYSFDKDFIKIYIKEECNQDIILSFLNNLGKSEYEFEQKQILTIEKFLKFKIDESLNIYNNKGNLYFKLLLAMGAVVAIIIW